MRAAARFDVEARDVDDPDLVAGDCASLLPELIAETYFSGADASSELGTVPVNPVTFDKMTPGTEFKAMFPGGKRIVPTFGLGVPSGADKALMEPTIEGGERKR